MSVARWSTMQSALFVEPPSMAGTAGHQHVGPPEAAVQSKLADQQVRVAPTPSTNDAGRVVGHVQVAVDGGGADLTVRRRVGGKERAIRREESSAAGANRAATYLRVEVVDHRHVRQSERPVRTDGCVDRRRKRSLIPAHSRAAEHDPGRGEVGRRGQGRADTAARAVDRGIVGNRRPRDAHRDGRGDTSAGRDGRVVFDSGHEQVGTATAARRDPTAGVSASLSRTTTRSSLRLSNARMPPPRPASPAPLACPNRTVRSWRRKSPPGRTWKTRSMPLVEVVPAWMRTAVCGERLAWPAEREPSRRGRR